LFDGNAGGKFPLAPLLRVAARRGQLSGELMLDDWTDVGTPARLQALNERLSQERG
jgi:MurNAc alpha-1-phosphate uridylyltransferase